MYNVDIWPGDHAAKRGISHEEAIHLGCEDKVYLEQLSRGLNYSFDKFKPDIVLYNAGTDVLINDPLGGCKVSKKLKYKTDPLFSMTKTVSSMTKTYPMIKATIEVLYFRRLSACVSRTRRELAFDFYQVWLYVSP